MCEIYDIFYYKQIFSSQIIKVGFEIMLLFFFVLEAFFLFFLQTLLYHGSLCLVLKTGENRGKQGICLLYSSLLVTRFLFFFLPFTAFYFFFNEK
jgi:hypothetical protein